MINQKWNEIHGTQNILNRPSVIEKLSTERIRMERQPQERQELPKQWIHNYVVLQLPYMMGTGKQD